MIKVTYTINKQGMVAEYDTKFVFLIDPANNLLINDKTKNVAFFHSSAWKTVERHG